MKYNILIFMFICFPWLLKAQQQAEVTVEKALYLIQNGMPKDATTMLEKEISSMSCSQNIPLYVKANILYLSALSQYEEEAIILSINHLKKTIPLCSEPATQILHSYLAELYLKTDRGFFGDDASVQSSEDVNQLALSHFRRSLTSAEDLFKIPSSNYDILFTETSRDEKKQQSTLYDILANRLFDNCPNGDFTETISSGLTTPLSEFLKLNIADDSMSFLSLSAITCQTALRLHQQDADPALLIQTDLNRILFFSKKNIDLAAYNELLRVFDNHPAVALVAFQKARYLDELPDNKDAQHRIKAAEICRTYSNRFPDSDGGQNCRNLLKKIESSDIETLLTEDVLPLSKSALAFVQFRNIHRLTCLIYNIPFEKMLNGFSNDDEKKFITDNTPLLQWEIEIPDPQDFLTHSTEFEIPPLSKSGSYLLVITPDPVFSTEKSLFITHKFQTSSLFPIFTTTTGEKACFRVMDRVKGLPLKGVSIDVFYGNDPENILDKLVTNENGIAYLSKDYNRSVQAVFSYGKDKIYSQGNIWATSSTMSSRKNYMQLSLFTDRVVYRPGQTIFWKGVLTEISENKVTPAQGVNVELSIRDANYQEITLQKAISDDFGGLDGSFTIPSNILNGNITLYSPYGTTVVRVESYKRPRFEVVFNKTASTYPSDAIVTITGNAIMLNGLPLQQAEINYNVSASIYRPLKFVEYRRISPQTIATGKISTKNDGSFEISFKTLPEQDDANSFFGYIYCITADVTDITGEIQTGTLNIKSGANVDIAVEADDFVMGSKNDEIKVLISGDAIQTNIKQITLAIEELKQSKTPITKRLWEIPDIKIINKKDFEKKFPQFSYDNDTLPVLKTVFSQDITSEIKEVSADAMIYDKMLKISDLIKSSGKYRIIVSVTVPSGKTVKTEKEFSFANNKEAVLIENSIFHIDKQKIDICEQTQLFLSSAVKGAKAYYTLIDRKGIRQQRWIALDKPATITITADTAMLPYITVDVQLVLNNRLYETKEIVHITDPSKALHVEVSGIRDKTMPGSKERWIIKIKDKENNPISAALFTTMYDAALDRFTSLAWNLKTMPNYQYSAFGSQSLPYSSLSCRFYNQTAAAKPYVLPTYYNFNWFDFQFPYHIRNIGMKTMQARENSAKSDAPENQDMVMNDLYNTVDSENNASTPEQTAMENTRRNFSETAFFYPNLHTDEDGSIVLDFVMPETLTRWNMSAIGYSKAMQTGDFKHSIVTESDFMVMPNLPRFLRTGDTCLLTTRIANKTDKSLSGIAKIMIEDVNSEVSLQKNVMDNADVPFTVNGNESITVSWKYCQSEITDGLRIRITATSGDFTDGEEMLLPVLPSEVVLQETIAMEMTQASSHRFTFENFDSNPQKLTVELATSPIWFAIQTLPTLESYQYENSDQLFNRCYTNILGNHVLTAFPKIKDVINQWSNLDSEALNSNLEKYKSNTSVPLSETIWVQNAQDETFRKHRLATMLNVNTLNYNTAQAVVALKQRQQSDGSFSWYPNMMPSEYITRYIVTGIGKLKALNISNSDLNMIADKAIQYLDSVWIRQYRHATAKDPYKASSYDVAYLYSRSFFTDHTFSEQQNQALQSVIKGCIEMQKNFDFNTRAMLTLALYRNKMTSDALTIAKSIDNYSIGNAVTGKYWRTQQSGINASDLSLSALMAEIYTTILNDKHTSNEVLTWLLRNKRTNDWMTSIATADAVYALISLAPEWMEPTEIVLQAGKETVIPEKKEAGTGYFSVSYAKSEIKPDMKTITITSKQENQIWGGAYLQYRKPIDEVKPNKNALLSVTRRLFKHDNAKLSEIKKNIPLKCGDRITVQLIVRADRDFDFVHLNDLRASALEPVDPISGYKSNRIIDYYLAVKDASMDFFFNHLPKGTWTIEYDLFVTQSGVFSNGYATVQCFYAPEFSATSEGIKLEIMP